MRLFATRLLSLSAQGSCLSNKPNLPVTLQGQRRYGDKKGEYGRQLNHGQCFGSDCWGSYSTGTSTPQQSSSKASQKNLEVSKLGTVLIPAPSVPGSVETAG